MNIHQKHSLRAFRGAHGARRGSNPEAAAVCSPDSFGFSLIELLVVITIIGLLAVAAVASISGFTKSRGIEQASFDVKGILELGRSEAVTRQTFVWATFREAINSGGLEIEMALAGSVDGTPNATGANLFAITRVVRASQVGLTNFAFLQPLTKALLTNGTPAELLTNTAGITYTNMAQAKFTNTTITFTPRGEAMMKGTPSAIDGFTPLIALGIVPARGAQKEPTPINDCAVVLDGSTGMPTILRRK